MAQPVQARAKAKAPLGVMIATYYFEQDPGLRDALVEETFTPFLGAESSTQKLDVAVGHPSALLEVVMREILEGTTSWGHLRLVARNFQPDLAEKMFEGG